MRLKIKNEAKEALRTQAALARTFQEFYRQLDEKDARIAELEAMMPQHDEHCWLTLNGEDWRITRLRGGMVEGRDKKGGCMWFHLENINWETYCEAAHRMLTKKARLILPGEF